MARIKPGAGGGRRIGGVESPVKDGTLPASIEIIFDEMLDAGNVPQYAPKKWVRFMVRVCRENPYLPDSLIWVLDMSERFYSGEESEADFDWAHRVVWEWEKNHTETASPYSLHGDLMSAASYRSVRGLICLLHPENMVFGRQGDLEEILSYFVPFQIAATQESAPDFHYRMTEILYECLGIEPEQNAGA